jgi:hypothetical protein
LSGLGELWARSGCDSVFTNVVHAANASRSRGFLGDLVRCEPVVDALEKRLTFRFEEFAEGRQRLRVDFEV